MMRDRWENLLERCRYLLRGRTAKRRWRALAPMGAAMVSVISSPAWAAGPATPTPVQIAAIHLESGVPFIQLATTPVSNPDNCAAAHVVTLASDLPNQQAYLSLAMTAFATGRKVLIFVNGCGPAPWASAPNVPKAYVLRMEN